jgi:hypothetical protein
MTGQQFPEINIKVVGFMALRYFERGITLEQCLRYTHTISQSDKADIASAIGNLCQDFEKDGFNRLLLTDCWRKHHHYY